jgi:amino acid transporter
MKRWLVFPFVVAIVAAMAALGFFRGSTAVETGGQVGVGKLLFLGLFALAGAAFIGWMAFLNQKQKRVRTMPVERPWKDDGTPEPDPFPEEHVAPERR